MKNTTIITIILLIITVITACVPCAQAEDNETFELYGVITEWRNYYDVVEYTVVVEDGTKLAFYGESGDYAIGDGVWLFVWDAVEQEVLDVVYENHFEPDEMARWLIRTDL